MPAYALLARIYLSQGKLEAALAEFDQIGAREPKNIAAKTMAAMVVDAQRNVPEAKRRYQEILDAAPKSPVAANNLAWIYAEEGKNLDEALRLAEAALQQLPDTPEVLDTVGWIHLRQELPSLAIRRFQETIQRDPGNAMYHYHLAMAYEKNGEAPQARAAAERAIALQPQFPDAQRLLATLRP
jgi:Flp pilus assembly protein TadD